MDMAITIATAMGIATATPMAMDMATAIRAVTTPTKMNQNSPGKIVLGSGFSR